jgi:hypothetical protein
MRFYYSIVHSNSSNIWFKFTFILFFGLFFILFRLRCSWNLSRFDHSIKLYFIITIAIILIRTNICRCRTPLFNYFTLIIFIGNKLSPVFANHFFILIYNINHHGMHFWNISLIRFDVSLFRQNLQTFIGKHLALFLPAVYRSNKAWFWIHYSLSQINVVLLR